jgi:hypothetical protein
MRAVRALPLFLLSAALFVACSKNGAPGSRVPLVSSVKAALAERDKKVLSYRYRGTTEEAGQKAEFSFAYRSPGKMRGDLESSQRTFAFDGAHFRHWDEASQLLTEIDLEAEPRDKAALFLHRVFAPFTPEGWRAPLLAGQLSAEQGFIRGRDCILVTANAAASGEKASVVFTFAAPAMDFLGTSVAGGGSTRVKAEHCVPGLGLCFPSVVEQTTPGAGSAVTRLREIEVNAPIAPELFELEPPVGAKVERKRLE